MSGMEMMLKSFGIDPNEIRDNAQKFSDAFLALNNRVENLEQQNARIEYQNAQILESLKRIEAVFSTSTETTINGDGENEPRPEQPEQSLSGDPEQ